MTLPEKPELAVNQDGETVADSLNGFIHYAATGLVGETHVDIATAYFNVGGYSLLADSLDLVDRVRILLGAEPDVREQGLRHLDSEPSSPNRAHRGRVQRALEGQHCELVHARDFLGFSVEADGSARRLVEWLKSGRVQVKRLSDDFLHGKAFLVSDKGHGVIAGSSNFTYAGLAKNVELNLGNYSPYVVDKVSKWFDELWDQAVEFDLAGLYDARFEEHSPQLIYLRMLFERYGQELVDEARDEGQPKIHLTTFQRDGAWRARRILRERNGVLIADEVGLGKTFLAGEIIREAAIDRRQRVLVVAPATLRDGPWRAFLSSQLLPVEVLSFEDLSADKRLNPDHGTSHKLKAAINDYAMVVVDEAHNLRNPATQRAEALRRLLAGSPRKDLVLLTATPVNNSLWDLYYLIGYFLQNDAEFADIGIKSLRDHFANAMALNPDDLTPEHLFDVLDAVAVRRTRSFVKKFYPMSAVKIDGVAVQIVFPTPQVIRVSYDLDSVMPGFFDRFAAALDASDLPEELGSEPNNPNAITLARYVPSRYRHDRDFDLYEWQLAGLIRSGLLKRFESSPYAFAMTCKKMAASHDAFLSLLNKGRVATGDALADWIATDSDDLDEVDKYLDGHVGLTDDVSEYRVTDLVADVEHDRDCLLAFADEALSITREKDPNLAALVEELVKIADEAADEGIGDQDTRDKRKVLIFSYYADTVAWIVEHLEWVVERDERLAMYQGRIASLTGGGTNYTKEEVLWGFAPRTTDAPEGAAEDRFDIVVTTDVLAEGVNLQQARHIVNYDLPWNPMRLVQRHGRIDRIGSTHNRVFLRCVFPDSRLDDLLGLEERLHHKIKRAARSVGVGKLLPDQDGVDQDFTETREEIERLRREETDIFERGGTTKGALSGEEYRQELRRALENDALANHIRLLPWGSGSGMLITDAQQEGTAYVFCIRVGDSDRVLFRYVRVVDGEPDVVDDTLACLDHARPPQGPDSPRHLDHDDYSGAFDAWGLARADVVDRWNWLSDKANLEPKVPKVLERAAETIRSAPPAGLNQEELERAVDTLQAPYPERILRVFRSALAASEDPKGQSERIIQVIKDLGLQPYQAPSPLPPIIEDDVHLVCWLALVPSSTVPDKASGVSAGT